MTDNSSLEARVPPAGQPQTAGHFTYRLREANDGTSIARLWGAETAWGAPQPDLIQWFNANPCAGSFIVVAVDHDGQVVGQVVMMATRVSVNGRDVPAIHAFAPIVSRAARQSVLVPDPRHHPIAEMFAYAVQEARTRAFALIYSMPSARWIGFFQRLPHLRYTQFPLWSVPLPFSGMLPIEKGFAVSRLVRFDERVDRLWHAAAGLSGCLGVRDARMLKWKLGTPYYEVAAVEHDGELVGLVAAQEKDGQWSIGDLLAADRGASLRATLAAGCNLGQAHALLPNRKTPLRKVALLTTPAIEPFAAQLGFARDAYDYLLLVLVLDPSMAVEDVAPERWYVSDNE